MNEKTVEEVLTEVLSGLVGDYAKGEAKRITDCLEASGFQIVPVKKTLGGHGKTFDVMAIAEDLRNSDLSQKAIARKHGCGKAIVQGINKGRNHSDKTSATEDKPLRVWVHAGGRPRNR